jgi:hypothetical protein
MVAEFFFADAAQKQSAKAMAAFDFVSPACTDKNLSALSKLKGSESISDRTWEAFSTDRFFV